jgi:hypothetical protein
VKLQVRAEFPTEKVVTFLDSVEYLHEGWTVDLLQKISFFCRIQTEKRELIGYCWYTDVPDSYRIKEFHVAIDTQYHGRWFDRTVEKQLCDIARLLDARLLFFCWHEPVSLQQMTMFGWSVEYPFSWKEL